jgi:hypothetical protein
VFGRVLEYAQLSIILGGPNVGKSNLINKVIMDGNHVVAALDLRSVGFTAPLDFHLEFQRQFSLSFYESMKTAAKSLSVDPGVTIEMPELMKLDYYDKAKDYRVGHFIRDLDRMAAMIPPFSIWKGKKSPVLFIDEAHKLKNMIKSPGDEGDDAIQSLLDWMVKNTKEYPRLHVVMASSDSFFLEWLEQRNIASYANVYTVGDLSCEDAERYYEHQKSKTLDSSLQKKILPFEEVYSVLGGHMYHIAKYIRDFGIEGKDLTWKNFSPLQTCFARIEDSLRPATFRANCEWSREDVIKTMIKLTLNEKKPFLEYSEFVNLIGEKAGKSLIKHTVFIYRHNKDYAFDLPEAPNSPIVTAASPMEHYAMKLLVRELEK